MKVDKGFSFSYWSLSYRRKMIRTLWLLPFLVVVPFALSIYEISIRVNVILSGIVLFMWLVQLIYNYIRYTKEEKIQPR